MDLLYRCMCDVCAMYVPCMCDVCAICCTEVFGLLLDASEEALTLKVYLKQMITNDVQDGGGAGGQGALLDVI